MIIKLAHGQAVVENTCAGCFLNSIIIDEDYRCKGIGTRLMNKVIDRCDRPIYLLATGELGGDPVRLKEFYKRFGFVAYRQKRSDDLPYNANMVLI